MSMNIAPIKFVSEKMLAKCKITAELASAGITLLVLAKQFHFWVTFVSVNYVALPPGIFV